MENKKLKISLVLNIIIVLFTIFATIVMFTGFKFMDGGSLLESTKLGMFRFYTVDSNLVMGIIALIFIIKEIELLTGKIDYIPSVMYILKLIGTVGVTLTFLVTFGYLAQIAKGGALAMIQNSNLFFHLLTPLFSIITFIFFEKTDKLKYKYTFLGVSSTLIYTVYYAINVLVHMENGKVSPLYDFYWFVQGGMWQIFVVIPLMLGITYGISTLLWKFNKMGVKNEVK